MRLVYLDFYSDSRLFGSFVERAFLSECMRRIGGHFVERAFLSEIQRVCRLHTCRIPIGFIRRHGRQVLMRVTAKEAVVPQWHCQ